MTTNIRISKINRDRLNELKQQGRYPNLDEVITDLLMVYEKYRTGKVVRLIE